MSEIPDDIMKAAYDCARGIYLSVDDAYTPYMTDDDIEVIAKAILTERQRYASLKALCDEMAKEARLQAFEEAAKIAESTIAPISIGRDHGRHHQAGAQSAARAIRSLAKAKEAESAPNPLQEQTANIGKEGL